MASAATSPDLPIVNPRACFFECTWSHLHTATLPLEDWARSDIEQWCLSLPLNKRRAFGEFFESLSADADGETLASYDKSDIEKRFKTEEGRTFAPEVFKRLQAFRKQGISSSHFVAHTPAGNTVGSMSPSARTFTLCCSSISLVHARIVACICVLAVRTLFAVCMMYVCVCVYLLAH